MKALFIDDDDLNNSLIELMLEDAGITDYAVFSSAIDALDYLETCHQENDCPSFIFLDLNMPEMSGYEFLDAFAEKYASYYPDVKIILLSSAPKNYEVNNYQKYNIVTAYIEKPLKEEDLKVFLLQ